MCLFDKWSTGKRFTAEHAEIAERKNASRKQERKKKED
jgi:hypothetical protein